MWLISNIFKENISNLLLQSQFGLVKTVATSASHRSSEKVSMEAAVGTASSFPVRGNRNGAHGRLQGWKAECASERAVGRREGPWHWMLLGTKRKIQNF